MIDRDLLIERLQFALEHRYAHNVVLISVATTKAVLGLLRPQEGAKNSASKTEINAVSRRLRRGAARVQFPAAR